MGWIVKPMVRMLHACQYPLDEPTTLGAVWRCDTCGKLWEFATYDLRSFGRGRAWRRATLLTRWMYRHSK